MYNIIGILCGFLLRRNCEKRCNMLAKRIIPYLDVRNGKAVKGVKFESVRDIGDPVEFAAEYSKQGADERVIYEINACIILS